MRFGEISCARNFNTLGELAFVAARIAPKSRSWGELGDVHAFIPLFFNQIKSNFFFNLFTPFRQTTCRRLSDLPAQNRSVAILKKLSMPPIFPVEPPRISGKKSAHEHGHRNRPGSEQKMDVLFYNRPSETIGFCFGVNKIQPIIIGPKNLPSFDPPDDHMMQRPWHVYSSFAWLGPQISSPMNSCKV